MFHNPADRKVGLKGKLDQEKRKEAEAAQEDCEDILGSGAPAKLLKTTEKQSIAGKERASIDLTEKHRTKETSQGEGTIQEENKDKVEKAQRLLQANFLKAVMIDDPALREFAITRLQNVQKKVNKGEDLDKIEAMMADLPWNPDTPSA